MGVLVLAGVNQTHLAQKPAFQGYFNTKKLRTNFLAMSLV